jgi:hypothetical protein
MTRHVRHGTIETQQQEDFVRAWSWTTASSGQGGSSNTRPTPSVADVQAAREMISLGITTLRPMVTLSRDGLILVAVEGGLSRPQHDFLFTDEAISMLALEIREVQSGSVPTLEAVTKGQAVVILAGDTLEGGKQNRVVNVSIWLAPRSVTAIPVTCLEQGRWNAPGGFAQLWNGVRKLPA